jgi:hypothetical protein
MFKIHTHLGNASILTVILSSSFALAQTLPPSSGNAATEVWHSDSVVYVAGLNDLKQNASGSLKIAADDLVFSTKDLHAQIPLRQITSVSVGDERVATGGTSAKLARKIPVFGFGAVAGAVTSKTVDVLTIEYQDANSGYHGAVFEVPKSQAEIAQKQLLAFAGTPHEGGITSSCNEATKPTTLLVAAIGENDLALPAEYRVLLYEQLVMELRKSYGGGTVLRMGDQAAACPAKTLHISVSAFKKGNQKLRSSTGPIGFFVGGTSVAFSVQLTDNTGAVVFEKRLKSSKHGDSDSLGVARDVAQSISKRLVKAKTSGFEGAA